MENEIKDIFDTEEKKNEAVLQFQSLQEHRGWQLVVEIVKQNILVLKKQLEDGEEGQTLEDIKRIRDKIKDHQNFIDTPKMMVTNFTTEAPTVPEADPYA